MNIDKFSKSLNKTVKVIIQRTAEAVDQANTYKLWVIKDLSPVDKWNYIKSNKLKKAIIEDYSVTWWVYNDGKITDPNKVESWRRKKKVNRHKWPPRNQTTRYYVGQGAKVYEQATKDIKSIKDIIKRVLSKI
jgi:hypothetical protein